jgi:hypothetical protein
MNKKYPDYRSALDAPESVISLSWNDTDKTYWVLYNEWEIGWINPAIVIEHAFFVITLPFSLATQIKVCTALDEYLNKNPQWHDIKDGLTQEP